MKHVGVSQSATPARRNDITPRDDGHFQMTTFAELTIGTAIATSRGDCVQLRTVAYGCATSSEHTLKPQTHRVKREPLLCIPEQKLSRQEAPDSVGGKRILHYNMDDDVHNEHDDDDDDDDDVHDAENDEDEMMMMVMMMMMLLMMKMMLAMVMLMMMMMMMMRGIW